MAEVALLGTGRMGSAMAERLAAAGHRVRVWNRTPATAEALVERVGSPYLVRSESPARAVDGVDAVLSVLSDGSVTESVLLDPGVLSALPTGCLVVDLATSGPATARRLASHLVDAGARFVDAPVSGSIPAVQGGTLLVMGSGRPEDVTAAGSVLSAFAGEILHVGAAGAGQAMKLAVNLVLHDFNAALAEGLRLAERSGVERAQAYEVLERSVVGAPFVRYKRPAFLDPTTPPAMTLDLVAKDLGLVCRQAAEVVVDLPVTDRVRRHVDAVVGLGWGARDMADLSRVEALDPSGTD